ncbi:MAG: hypothetical protein OIF34_05725, partial [Porticoccaceae bacterium]|nr:hypothetical protein [Porticoccaceae bacterium]
AKAGIHKPLYFKNFSASSKWIPACAGMTSFSALCQRKASTHWHTELFDLPGHYWSAAKDLRT